MHPPTPAESHQHLCFPAAKKKVEIYFQEFEPQK